MAGADDDADEHEAAPARPPPCAPHELVRAFMAAGRRESGTKMLMLAVGTPTGELDNWGGGKITSRGGVAKVDEHGISTSGSSEGASTFTASPAMPTAGETTALGYDAKAGGGDPRAQEKLAFTAEFVQGLLAHITDKVLEEPSQLEQVRTRCRPTPQCRIDGGIVARCWWYGQHSTVPPVSPAC